MGRNSSITKLLLGLLTALSLSAHSQQTSQNLAAMYKAATLELIQVLEEAGLHEVACEDHSDLNCLSPYDLRNTLENLTFEVVDGFKKPEGATRWGLFYAPAAVETQGKNKIFVNSAVDHPPEIMGCMGLHEIFGVLKRPEDELEASMASCFLQDLYKKSAPNIPDYLPGLKGQIRGPFKNAGDLKSPITDANSLLSDGGVTVVGGGGDPAAFLQRQLFYNYLLESSSNFKNYHLLGVLIPIEVSPEDSEQVQYVLDPQVGHGWPRHAIFPKNLIDLPPLKDPKAPNRAVEDLAFYLTSIAPILFPAFGIEQVTVKYPAPGGHQSYFSYPRHPERVHPLVLENFFQPLWQKRCGPSGGKCRVQ